MSIYSAQYVDQAMVFEGKAEYLALKITREYLNTHLDEAAKRHLERFERSHSITPFHMAFFQKHALVYSSFDAPVAFNCNNPSACAIALLRELDQ